MDMEEEEYSHRHALCSLVQVGGCFEAVELQELMVLLDEGVGGEENDGSV